MSVILHPAHRAALEKLGWRFTSNGPRLHNVDNGQEKYIHAADHARAYDAYLERVQREIAVEAEPAAQVAPAPDRLKSAQVENHDEEVRAAEIEADANKSAAEIKDELAQSGGEGV